MPVHAEHRRPLTRLAAVVAAASLAFTACAGSDDEDATADDTTTDTAADTTDNVDDTAADTAAPTTDTATDTDAASTTTTADTAPSTTDADTAADDPATGDDGEDAGAVTVPAGDDGTIVVGSIDELPQECVDALADFLQAIEPAVSEIDWDAATVADFEAVSEEIADEGDAFDATGACGEFDLGDDEAIQSLIDFAEEEAPGVIGWLEFIQEVSTPSDTGAAAELTTCDDAIAYMEDLLGDGVSIDDLPAADFAQASTALDVIFSECTEEQAAEILDLIQPGA
jgi:hypothetical protein